MRTAKLVACTVITVVVIIAVICYVFLRSEGLTARNKPGKLECLIANRALSISIPASAKNTKNPMNPNADALTEAAKDYSDHCAPCHASDGAGNTEIARGLSPEVPDLRSEHIQKLSDGEIFYIIKSGVRFTGMPSAYFQDERIWRLVLLIRNFAIKKSGAQ